METKKRKNHSVQVVVDGVRYVAVEFNGIISMARNGTPIGKAKWKDDQLVDNSAILADNVSEALEKAILERVLNNWDED